MYLNTHLQKDSMIYRINLTFCPTPGYYNKEKLKSDIKTFTRKIKLREYFYNNNKNQQTKKIVTIIKCKSN